MNKHSIDPDKYVVLKREDVEDLYESFRRNPNAIDAFDIITERALPGCVVIRKQDVFAHSALSAYASAILTAMEVMEHTGTMDEDTERYLTRLADFFAGEADEARKVAHKLPD